MSRFFRSGSSSSSSASELLSDDEEDLLSASQLIARNDQQVQDTSQQTAVAVVSEPAANHRDLLLHALLEERCQRQARDELGQHASAERVRRLAEAQYQALSSRLAAYGLVEAGYDTSAYSSRRQAVRDGLDSLNNGMRQPQRGTDLIRQEDVQQLTIGVDTLQLFRPQIELPRLPPVPSMGLADMLLRVEAPSLTGPSLPALLNGTRYVREFEEIGTLGRGGYGIVYHCKHRFDGLSYAVKKIPLSTSRLQTIREKGQAEVDRMLLELTTLARLDHPNIVRYFGGWVEFTTLNQQSITYDSDATFGASEHTHHTSMSRSWRVAEVSGNNFITFESSAETSEKSSEQGSALHRQSTQDTQATVSDGDIESIDRSVSPDMSTLSTFTQDAAPCLAVHIQMSLYPFSLADYLSTATVTQHKHCFHLEPSLRILSALIDGISYLHTQGVVHRDLKPANVFLAHDAHKQGWCRQCTKGGTPCVDGVKARIGDLGLVAALASQDTNDYSLPVGTELYRPNNDIDRSRLEALDWFALGMIAFELLWPFSTRMERHETLTALKNGLYPHTFDQRFTGQAGDIAKLIGSLLQGQHAVDEIRNSVAAMLATC